jgi:hypothetical protein
MEVLAACHLHSVWSYDGAWPLEALVARFSGSGHRVLMMTEHDRGFTASRYDDFRDACARASNKDTFVLPGVEYSDPENRVHVLVWGRLPFLGEGLRTDALLEAVKSEGGFAVLAHPGRREAWRCFDPQWADCLLGVEVWNRKYDGWAPGDDAAALLQSTGVVPFVGLDFHTARQSFPLAMALAIAGPVGETSILACLKAGRCSARAFGVPLSRPVFKRSVPLLKVAEQSRRTIASVRRYSRTPARR